VGEEHTKNSSGNAEVVNYEEMFKQEQGRRRGLQSENAKLKNDLELTKAEVVKVRELTAPKIPAEEAERLDTLKFKDPDAWRAEMDKLEGTVRAKVKEHRGVLEQENSKKSKQKLFSEALETLSVKYKDFSKFINKDVLADDIPPKLTRELSEGTISEEEFLEKAYKFMSATKPVANPTDATQPNLGNTSGGTTPDVVAVNEDLNASYSETIF